MAPNEFVYRGSRVRWLETAGRAIDDNRSCRSPVEGDHLYVVVHFDQSLGTIYRHPWCGLFERSARARGSRVGVALVVLTLCFGFILLVLLNGWFNNWGHGGARIWKLRLHGLHKLRSLLLCLLLFGGLLEELLTTFLALDETEINSKFQNRKEGLFPGDAEIDR